MKVTTGVFRISVTAILVAFVSVGVQVAGWSPQAKPPQKPPITPAKPTPTPGAAKAPEPWPDAKTLADHKKTAENRRLFRSDAPLEFTLTANFKAVNGDRDVNSTKVFPATIEFAKDDGTKASVPLNIRLRGHARRAICTFGPLRLEFPKDRTKNTVFDGYGVMKLGTHCRSEFSDYIVREYAAYKIYNLLTPQSFRVRLAKATYVDAGSKKVVATKYAMFIEDDDDVAKRLEGRITELQGVTFNRVDMEGITRMTLFEYLIGNTDMSLFAQHNVQIVATPAGLRYPIPYDFDYSGLVYADYATPGTGSGLVSVRDRKYYGPCHTAEEFEPYFAKLRAIKNDVMKILDPLEVPDKYRTDAKAWLDKFYKTIDSPAEVKKNFIDNCKGRPYM